MKVQPLSDYLLVRIHEQERESGIIVPDQIKLDPYGEVLAVGMAVKHTSLNDKVVFHAGNGTRISQDGEQLVLVQESSCIAKYVPDPVVSISAETQS